MTEPLDTPLDDFESRLLLALRAEVGRPSRRPSRRPAPSRQHRPLWARSGLAAGAAATAVLTGTLVLQHDGGATTAAPSPSTSPSTSLDLAAFSVEKERSGDVEVVLHRLDDAAGLERALADQGVRAEVVYDPEMKAAAVADGDQPTGSPDAPRIGKGWEATKKEPAGALRCVIDVRTSDEGAVFRVPAALVDADRALDIRMGGSLDDDSWAVAVSWSGAGC